MLKGILDENEINLLAIRHTNALNKFGNVFNSEEQKKQFKLLSPLKEAKFSLREAKNFNFEAGKEIWSNCLNWHTRNKGGRPKLKESISDNINLFMKRLSSHAANRFLKRLRMNAMYRNTTYKSAYYKYPLKEKMSFSTFKNKICKRFKKPHRFSDLCDTCEHGKVNKTRINHVI
jgi:hypothetical protein